MPLQTRQSGLEGTGEIRLRDLVKESLRMRPSRIIVGEVRAEECLDLLLALNAGLPGMCTIHANSAREALVKMCTLPLLAGENISARFVVPDRRGRRSTWSSTSASTSTAYAGSTRSSACPGRVENDVIETEPIFERRGGELRRAGGMPPHLERFERVGIDVHRILAGAAADGCAGRARGRHRAAAGLVRVLPAAPSARRAPRRRGRTAELLARAGLGQVSVTGFVLLCVVCGAGRRRWWCRSSRGTPPVALAFGADGRLPAGRAWSPGARGAASASSPRSGRRRSTTSTSAVRAGMSLPDALAALGARGPEPLRDAFDQFALDYQVTGRFGECLDRLKDRLADPVGDRVVEGLRIAREVGGGELGRLLRNLSGYLREDARTRSRAGVAAGLDRQRRAARGRGAVAGAAASCRSSPR